MKTYNKLYITDDGDPWAPNNFLKYGEKEKHKLNRGGMPGECIGLTNNALVKSTEYPLSVSVANATHRERKIFLKT